jgi:hypothetical protein
MTGYIIFGLILAAFVAPLLAATRPPLRREPLGPKGRTFIGILLAALGAILFPVVTAWIVGTLAVLGAGTVLLARRHRRMR